MFQFKAIFTTNIKCGCDGYYQLIEKLEDKKYPYGYQKMQCNKCQHVIFVEIGQQTITKGFMGENEKCFSALKWHDKEE